MTRTAELDHDATGAATVRTRITRDSLWLASGFAATAGSGFVFWLLAALWISQTRLGIEASVLSAVMAAAALASNGPGSALVVMLPVGGPAAREALRRGCLAAGTLALLFGAVAGVLVAVFLPTGMSPWETIPIVTACTVVWALFNVQAQALAGASDARSTLVVSAGANIAKIVLLVLFAFPLPGMPHPLVSATMLPAAVVVVLSLGVLLPRALRRDDLRTGSTRAWDPGLAGAFRRFSVQNAVAVGIVLCAGLSLSFLVTTLSSPAEGAIFAIAFQFSVALDLVGVAVATALARSAAGTFEPSAGLAAGYARKVALTVAALGLAATLVTPLMFLVLGRDYPPLYGMAVVGVLAVASAVRPGYDLWSALSRARHRVRPVLAGNALYVVLVLGLVAALVPPLGALGAAVAVAAGAAALAVIGAFGIRRTRTWATPSPLDPEGAVA